jgi:hypothetical protein
MSVEAFYGGFARDYDLAYAGRWDAAVERQGAALERVLRAAVPDATSVLDCAAASAPRRSAWHCAASTSTART